jgi:hypothetical protein
MGDHLQRIRLYMSTETEVLRAKGQQTRAFDHNTNKGNASEHAIVTWLHRRFGPDYAISPGEVIDSFSTDVAEDSRQQDGILHSGLDANRFVLPNGSRLVPVESVAAIVEVKLTLSKTQFEEADKAATQTARLRFRPSANSYLPTHAIGNPTYGPGIFRSVSDADRNEGIPLHDARLRPNGPIFAVFGYEGTETPETLAGWLRDGTTISLACCLSAGCAFRPSGASHVRIAQQPDALAMFAHSLWLAIDRHEGLVRHGKPSYEGYFGFSALTHWDESGYELRSGYVPAPGEAEAIEDLYRSRPELRPKAK